MRPASLHARLLVEGGNFGGFDEDYRYTLCLDCAARGCPLCDGTGWVDAKRRHLAVVPDTPGERGAA